MAKFTEDHKKEMNNNYFEEGVHKVTIKAVTLGMTPENKEYLEFALAGAAGEEDNARIWFTTDKAIGYSFNIVKGIFVHNAPEAKKDAAKAAVDALADTEALEKACQSLIGKEAWFSVYKNPERTYTKKDGTTGVSFDRNITGYEPTTPKVKTPAPTANPPASASGASDGGEPFGF